MASGGVGSGNHIFGELFKMMTGINLVHVPYRGAGPALVDLLGGQVQVMFASMSSSIGYVRAGKLRALAVTTLTRSPVLPDIPTVAEFVSGYEASFWTGIGAQNSNWERRNGARSPAPPLSPRWIISAPPARDRLVSEPLLLGTAMM